MPFFLWNRKIWSVRTELGVGSWGGGNRGLCACVCMYVCACVRLEKERDTRYDRCREAPSIARLVTCNQALHPLQFHPHIYTELPVESPGIAATTTSLPTFSIFHYLPLFHSHYNVWGCTVFHTGLIAWGILFDSLNCGTFFGIFITSM